MKIIADNFKVVAQSDNTNSFGLKQYIAMNAEGKVFKACKNPQFLPKNGEKISIPFNLETGKHNFCIGGELSEAMPDAPEYLIQEVWPENY